MPEEFKSSLQEVIFEYEDGSKRIFSGDGAKMIEELIMQYKQYIQGVTGENVLQGVKFTLIKKDGDIFLGEMA